MKYTFSDDDIHGHHNYEDAVSLYIFSSMEEVILTTDDIRFLAEQVGLLEPPEPALEYPWKDFPLAQWAAVDEYGDLWFYTNEPKRFSDTWGDPEGHSWLHPSYTPPKGFNWATSKQQRPENL